MNKPKAFDFKRAIPPFGFLNMNSLVHLDKVTWLHPVQSLFGNWDGNVLILGQDFNGENNLLNFKADEFKHDPSFETNINLVKVFGNSTNVLYANFFWFIKKGSAQTKFSVRKEVVDANLPIFLATVSAMKHLTHIFVMGSITSKKALGLDFFPLVESKVLIGDRIFYAMPIPHLGVRGLGNFCKKRELSKVDALNQIKSAIDESLKNSLYSKG